MVKSDKTVVQPTTSDTPIDTSDWPYLLKNYSDLAVRSGHYTPLPYGCSPSQRPISAYLNYGIINLDKPVNPSSHEVVSWLKRIMKCDKTGHSGTLDPKVSGVLLVCLNRATRLVKAQQGAGKEYVCICKFHSTEGLKLSKIRRALENLLTGALFQRPPLISAVKRQLRVRTVYENEILDYNEKRGLLVFRVKCEAGTYIRTLCVHLGLMLGVGAHMAELRRIRSGCLDENEASLVSMHDVLDAFHNWRTTGDESLVRSVVYPLERILMTDSLKRIVVKDSTVNAICYGAKLMIPGVLRFDKSIELGDDLILMTNKGEAIATGVAQMTSQVISSIDHGVVATLKRVIMERDTYNQRWGMGAHAQVKKQLISEGKLTDKGRPNENTPVEWLVGDLSKLPRLTAGKRKKSE